MAKLNPYLSFRSEAKDALAFYRSALGGELDISTFGGFPMEGMTTPDEDKDLVMHGQLDTPGGLTIMAADTPSRSEEHTSELQSRENLVCRLLLEKKKTKT